MRATVPVRSPVGERTSIRLPTVRSSSAASAAVTAKRSGAEPDGTKRTSAGESREAVEAAEAFAAFAGRKAEAELKAAGARIHGFAPGMPATATETSRA